VIRNVTPCSVVDMYQCFKGPTAPPSVTLKTDRRWVARLVGHYPDIDICRTGSHGPLYGLFNKAVSRSEWDDERELSRPNVRYLPGMCLKGQENWCPGQDLNQSPPN
jgi:hypothetical protein